MHRSLFISSASALLLFACGPEGDGPIDGELKCETGLLTGDLVITEVMANPDGDDQGNEYFEIYNATGAAIDLRGLRLEKSAVAGDGLKTHVMTGTIVEAGAYVALGGVLPEFRAPYIAYGYASDLGTMTNAGGQLSLHCAGTEVDRIFYREAASGRSQGLDGNITPDHIINDDSTMYCDATTEFATGAFGSPGVKNEPCSIVEQTTCLENGTARDVLQPGVGDIVITEFIANPSGADGTKEWFELQATASFDLNGLVAGEDTENPQVNLIDENCLVMNAGDRIVFAQSEDNLVNGGLPVVDYTFSFSLNNTEGATTPTLFVGVGETILDIITWTSSTSGASTALDPGSIDATANDDESNWCDGKEEYGDGDLGTPGTTNPLCDTSGMCMDGASLRATVPPIAADVTITEWMANPEVVSDTTAEWFEVHFASAVDLNGLQLGKTVGPPLNVITTLSEPTCLSIPADTHVVFARSLDEVANGGLPDTNIFLGNIPLTNGGDSIFVAIGDVVLDTISYVGSTAGASTQVDSVGATCDGTDGPYGLVTNGNLGTPGGVNTITCP